MIKKKKEGFVVVSAFSKPPLKNRISSLFCIYFFVVMLEVANAYYTRGIIRTLASILIISSLVIITVRFIKLKGEFSRSPFHKLQRYIHDNRMYEDEIHNAGYDREGNPKKKRVIYNSIVFSIKETGTELIVRIWKNADKFTEKANMHDTMLSALFGKELSKKYDNVKYCDYVFDLLSDKRITMSDKRSTYKTTIQMTEKISWSLGKPPHTLIVGSTNSGKTYLVSLLVLDYLRMGAELLIADPKSADLSIIGRHIDIERYGRVINTAASENEIARLLRQANEKMEDRYKKWFSDENSFGKTWRDIPDARPLVIIFDEYSAFVSVSSSKAVKEVNGYLGNLLLKGRQCGIEVVMLMQRPDTSIISGNLRDQFGVRIGLSNMTTDGRRMLFGFVDMQFKTIQEMGGGYILIDGQSEKPIYFEAPLISGGMDYIDELEKAIHNNTD